MDTVAQYTKLEDHARMSGSSYAVFSPIQIVPVFNHM